MSQIMESSTTLDPMTLMSTSSSALNDNMPASPAEFAEQMGELAKLAGEIARVAETLNQGMSRGEGPLNGEMIEGGPIRALHNIACAAADMQDAAEGGERAFTDDPDHYTPLITMLKEHGTESWLAK